MSDEPWGPELPAAPRPSPAHTTSGQGLTVQDFLARNDPRGLVKERDKVCGWMRWVNLLILAFLLISPLLVIIPTLSGEAWVLGLLWIPIAFILCAHWEFSCRAEVWHMCIARGIIVDFSKRFWLTNPVLIVNFFFILFAAGLVIKGNTDEEDTGKRVLTGLLFIPGLAFTIGLSKAIVGLEMANKIMTVNTFLDLLGDPAALEHRGFKVIHETQMLQWSNVTRPGTLFSWNDLYSTLSHTEDKTGLTAMQRMTWGVRVKKRIKPNQDATD